MLIWPRCLSAQAELARLDAPFRPKLAANPRLAYGSTVASTLITGTFILYMQLGDGDIVTVNADGVVAPRSAGCRSTVER